MTLQKNSGYNLVSLEEVQSQLGNSSTSLTSFLNFAISVKSMQIENICGVGLSAGNYTDYYDGNGSDILFLSQQPIISISSLQYQLTPTSDWVNYYTGSATANIQYSQRTGKLKLYNSFFYEGMNNIKIIYRAGFETIPSDLKQICIEEVIDMYNKSSKGESRLGVNSTTQSNGQGSFTQVFKDLSEEHKLKLYRSYKKPVI